MNKKGQVPKYIGLTIVRLVFTGIVLGMVVFLVSFFTTNSLETKDMEREMLFHSIMYSPDGVLWKDPETGRTTPGVLNASLLNSTHLDEVFHLESGRDLSAFVSVGTHVAYINEKWYNRTKPLANANIGGTGGATKSEWNFKGSVYEGETLTPADITIIVISSN